MKNKNTEQQKGKPSAINQGSGSTYNDIHAGGIPDYGMNDIDPNAAATSNISDYNKALEGKQ